MKHGIFIIIKSYQYIFAQHSHALVRVRIMSLGYAVVLYLTLNNIISFYKFRKIYPIHAELNH